MFVRKMTAGWGDMDFNGHMRNTSFLDKSADLRMMFFSEHGFPADAFARLRVGPVIMRDEVDYFREIGLLDEMSVTISAAALSEDGSRFRIRNEFFRADGKRAASVTSAGGWLDLAARKLVLPPADLLAALQSLPRADDFVVLARGSADRGVGPATRQQAREETFAASPERLFAALHTSSAIRGWWGAARVVVIPEKGGTWVAAWGEDEDAPDYVSAATLREFDPPHRLVFADYRYHAKSGPLPFRADFVTEFAVSAHPDGAVLRVVQDGFPAERVADDFYEACGRGWRDTFAGIRRFLESRQ